MMSFFSWCISAMDYISYKAFCVFFSLLESAHDYLKFTLFSLF